MTVSSYAKNGPYAGDGTTGQEFAITFEFFSTSEVVATSRVTATGVEDTLTEGADYTITTEGSDPYTGGTLALIASLSSAYTLTISRASAQTQTLDLEAGGELAAENIEEQFDKIVMWLQEMEDKIDRCLKIPLTDGETLEAATELANAVDRASTYLAFSSDGSPTETASVAPATATITAFAETILDDASAAAILTTLLVSAFAQTLLDDTTAAAARTTLGTFAIADVLAYENASLFYENELLVTQL